MLRNKYAKDYRIESYGTAKGKIREKAIYTGPLYSFPDARKLRITALFNSFLGLAGIILWLAGLWNYSAVTRKLYVSVPMLCVCAVLSSFFSSAMKLLRLTTEQTFRREEKEKSVDRARGSSLAGILFCLAGFCAVLFYGAGVSFRFSFYDWFYLICTVLQLLIFTAGFIMTKKLSVQEVHNPSKDTGEKEAD